MADGWKYYNHAMIPTCAPHENVDMSPLMDRSIWKTDGGTPLFARWTSEFDCGYETVFWYCIKDEAFDIQKLKAKRRYEIVKGCRNFTCRRIEAKEYVSQITDILAAAAKEYPLKYRNEVNREEMHQQIPTWDKKFVIYGAFDLEGKLCGYAYLEKYKQYSEFRVLKVYPECEKKAINAALVACILEDYERKLQQGHYICDRARPMQHETNFQSYLEKYFGFRKAYCKLHIKYRFPIKYVVNILYVFRNLIKKHDNSRITHQISGLLKMEEIVRNQGHERHGRHGR